MMTPAISSRGTVIGKAPAAKNGSVSIVVLQRKDAKDVPPPEADATMDQVQLTFIPAMLFARTGYPIEFTNSDEEMHNMNVKESGTREQAPNVAIPPGGTYRHTFTHDGMYDVSCDVHPAMSAQIIITSTPYAAGADRDGTFTFNDVPAGEYILTAYAGRERFEEPVTVAGSRTEVHIGNQQ
jgi:plastocyanin